MQVSPLDPPLTRSGPRRYIGTSGWQYADWRGVLYPKRFPQRRWLERYSETFDTVEVNNTFYGLPAVTTAEKWADDRAAGFRIRRQDELLRDPWQNAARHSSADTSLSGAPLGDRLTPRTHRRAAPAVAGRRPRRSRGDPGRTSQEPPDRGGVPSSQLVRGNAIRAALERHGAALIWADRAGRMQNPDWVTTDWLYLRLHGGRGRAGNYGPRVIDRYASQLATLDREAFVYFNNDMSGNAVRNARALVARLQRG